MPGAEECDCTDSCIQGASPGPTDPVRRRHLSTKSWNTRWDQTGRSDSMVVWADLHPWYCRTCKPAFQSLTYMSPSVVT